jgi:hypothetical protein
MRRMPRGAVGVLLAIGLAVPGRSASAQAVNPQPRVQPNQVKSVDVAPDPTSSNSLDARDGELRLPIEGLRLPAPERPKADAETPRGGSQTLTAPQLPLKWGHPSESWETQVKKLEIVHLSQTRAVKEQTQPALTLVPQPKLPTPIEPKKPPLFAAASKSSRGKAVPHPNFAETRTAPTADQTGRRPGSSEESEPKVIATSEDKQAPRTPQTPLRSARQWPSAYVTGPSDGKGRLGAIDIDEDAPMPSVEVASSGSRGATDLQSRVKSLSGWRVRDALVAAWPPAYVTGPPAKEARLGVIHIDEEPPAQPAKTAVLHPIALENLQRRIQSLCGQQARGVEVVGQPDGTVMVKVKAATTSVESQLSRKILAIPDMTSPKVRLMMEVGP